MRQTILTKGVAKQSEKAVCMSCLVNWNCEKPRVKDIWFPKSVCEVYNGHLLEVEDWFLRKLSQQNAFHGYTMSFEILRFTPKAA